MYNFSIIGGLESLPQSLFDPFKAHTTAKGSQNSNYVPYLHANSGGVVRFSGRRRAFFDSLIP